MVVGEKKKPFSPKKGGGRGLAGMILGLNEDLARSVFSRLTASCLAASCGVAKGWRSAIRSQEGGRMAAWRLSRGRLHAAWGAWQQALRGARRTALRNSWARRARGLDAAVICS